MLAGAVIAAAIGFLIALIVGGGFDVIDLGVPSTRFFPACYAAVVLGVIISVLTRMRSDNFPLHDEVGTYPCVSSSDPAEFNWWFFGPSIYFALQSELVQLQQPEQGKAFFFFTLFAFVAGFSERLTHVILGGAERTVAGTLEQADKAVGEISTTKTTENGTTTITTRKTPPASS